MRITTTVARWVVGVTGVTQVVTGDRHGCVLTKAQTVQCWGMNDAGQLGTKPDVQQHILDLSSRPATPLTPAR